MASATSTASNGWPTPQANGIKMRACANCSRLKMKCRWPAGASPTDTTACTRCERLGISCGVPSSVPRKKRGKSNRVAQLEQKLDGIMSILESNQRASQMSAPSTATPSNPANAPSPLTPDSQCAPRSGAASWPYQSLPPEARQAAEQIGELESPTRTGFVDGGVAEKFELVPGFTVTITEATEYLHIYRRDYMPMFPFVIIEETTKPHELYYNAPALFWMIMAAVAHTPEEVDSSIKKWLRQYLAERVIVRQEKTLEILQAILIHLVWGSFHFFIDSDTPVFINLAQNIVLDLRLDWPPESGQVQRQSLLGAAWCHMNKTHLMKKRRAHTPAEIRAVLGLHHASSVTMTMFRRGPGVAWNMYLTKCCESMAALCQHPLDELMTASVRLQRVAQKGLSALPGTEYVWGPSSIVYGHAQEMTITLTRDNMEKFVKSQRPEVQNSSMFRLLYHALLVRLYEPVLGMQPATPNMDNSANASGLPPFRRSDMLWRLVEACKTFFEVRSELSMAETTLRPSTTTGFVAFTVVTSSRVLFHAAEDWDPAVARRFFDYGAAMVRLAEQFERAGEWAQGAGRRRQMMDDKMTLFEMYAQKMRWIQQWYQTRIETEEAAAAAGAGSEDAAPQMDVGAAGGSVDEVAAAAGAAATTTTMAPEEVAGGGLSGGGQHMGGSGGSDAPMTGVGMPLETDQQPIPSFLPDYQFDDTFWQEMLMWAQPPPFGGFNIVQNTL